MHNALCNRDNVVNVKKSFFLLGKHGNLIPQEFLTHCHQAKQQIRKDPIWDVNITVRMNGDVISNTRFWNMSDSCYAS